MTPVNPIIAPETPPPVTTSLPPVVVHEKIAALEEGHATLTEGHEENKAAAAETKAQVNDWSNFFTTPVGKAVGILAAALTTMILTLIPVLTLWIADKLKTPPPPAPIVTPDVKPAPPIIINVPTPPTPLPGPVPPAVKTQKLIIYVVVGQDVDKIAADPALKELNLTVLTTPAGYVYPFKGKILPVPCVAVTDSAGLVLDVQPWTNAEAAAALVKRS